MKVLNPETHERSSSFSQTAFSVGHKEPLAANCPRTIRLGRLSTKR
jgi:hypothetical protein